MIVKEPRVIHNFYDDVLKGEGVKSSQKRFSQIKNLYKNSENINDDTLMYTVYSYENGDPTKVGNLNWGLTVLEPVFINGECNMTHGHFHENRECVEYYFGCGGEGLLLLMNEKGEMWAEKIFKGSLHYISGNIAHRTICTGDRQCLIGACWSPAAGHDYKSIDEKEFPYRVFKKDKEIVFEER